MGRDWLQTAIESVRHNGHSNVLAGAAAGVGAAIAIGAWHRWVRRQPWPQRWL